MEGELGETKTSLRETQGQIQGMKDKVAEANATMERVVREHRELNEKLEFEYSEKDRRLKDNLKAQMNNLITEQMAEIGALQGDFGKASDLMDQKYRDLNAQFTEL